MHESDAGCVKYSESAYNTRHLQLAHGGIAAVSSGSGMPWIMTLNLANIWIYEPNAGGCWALTALIGHQIHSDREAFAARDTPITSDTSVTHCLHLSH